MKKEIKKILGISAMISSVALEIAAVISALPMRKYRAKYQKYLNEYEDNKNKLTQTRVRTIVLGASAVALAIVGIKFNKKSDGEEVVENDLEVKKVVDTTETVSYVEKIVEAEEKNEEALEEIIEEIVENEKIVEAEEKEADASEEFGGSWECEECGHENDGEKKVCSYCGTLRSDILNQALQDW